MDTSNIKGLDLKIDNSIHEICKTSNETSSSTRTVLYILLLVNILAIISFLNSYEFDSVSNWTNNRIKKNINDIGSILDRLPDTTKNKTYFDSTLPFFNLEITKKRLENNLKNEMENVHSVQIPVLGNQFDINDFGLIGGITIILLMIITKFTLTREVNNLKIALTAITKRYVSNANEEDFASFLSIESDKSKRTDLLSAINYIRRQHHYNFLSMNEIFNSPPLEITHIKKNNISEKIIMNMFWFPALIYLIIFINDLYGWRYGFELSKANTIILLSFESLFSAIIFYYAYLCTSLKYLISNLYADFKKNEYQYNN